MSRTDQGTRCIVRRSRLGAPPAALLVVSALALFVISGCGTARATSPSTSPSPTLQPVQVALIVEQQGSVEAHTLRLVATISVTNRSPEPIGIASWPGFVPEYVRFDVYTATYGTKMWDNGLYTSGICSFSCRPTFDASTLAPGSSQIWTATMDISKAGGFVSNLKYRVVATFHWHTGPLPADPIEQNKVFKETDGEAQITLT